MFLSFNVKLSICRANIRRSREQNKFICYAEAQQYFRRSRISQKPRAEQIYLLCRGATVFPAKPNIAEAESRTNLFVMPRRNSISGEGKYSEKPNIAEAESGVPRKKGTGTRFVRGGGKVLRFHGKTIHFPPRIQHCISRCYP